MPTRMSFRDLTLDSRNAAGLGSLGSGADVEILCMGVSQLDLDDLLPQVRGLGFRVVDDTSGVFRHFMELRDEQGNTLAVIALSQGKYHKKAFIHRDPARVQEDDGRTMELASWSVDAGAETDAAPTDS